MEAHGLAALSLLDWIRPFSVWTVSPPLPAPSSSPGTLGPGEVPGKYVMSVPALCEQLSPDRLLFH